MIQIEKFGTAAGMKIIKPQETDRAARGEKMDRKLKVG